MDKLKLHSIDIVNNIPICNGNNSNGGNNIMPVKTYSKWAKIKNSLAEFFKFMKNYVRKPINLVELLYLVRPLIYLGFMMSFKKNSFIPVIVNLAIDLIVIYVKRSYDNFEQQKIFSAEYIYRLGRLAVYFLRNPIFTIITQPFIRKLIKVLRFPNFLCDVIMALLSYYTNLYFIL